MKNLTLKRIVLYFILLIISLIFIPNFSCAADPEIDSQDTLVSAIESAKDNDIISLKQDITLVKPISVTGKNITINGNGHTISKADTGWQPNGEDGSLITAGGTGTKLTLKKLTFKNAQKYGVQSYNDAYVVLDDVTFTDNGYGAVLVNAGTVEIKKVKLNKNGQYGNNGIEIGKGGTTGDNKPILIMNGTITSTQKENVVYIADNDNLKEFEVKNADSTTDKILVKGNKVVITDKNNKVLYESNKYDDNLKIEGQEYDAEIKKEDSKDNIDKGNIVKNKKDNSPKTGINNILPLSMIMLTVGIILLIVIKKREV